jgi:hypothetical protein
LKGDVPKALDILADILQNSKLGEIPLVGLLYYIWDYKTHSVSGYSLL